MRVWLGLLLGLALLAATSVANAEYIGMNSALIGCRATPPDQRKPLLPPPERDLTEPILLQIQPVDWSHVKVGSVWYNSPEPFRKAPPMEKYTSILSSHWGYFDGFATGGCSVWSRDLSQTYWAIDNIEVIFSIDGADLPEPASLILLLSGGLAGLAWLRRAKGRPGVSDY